MTTTTICVTCACPVEGGRHVGPTARASRGHTPETAPSCGECGARAMRSLVPVAMHFVCSNTDCPRWGEPL